MHRTRTIDSLHYNKIRPDWLNISMQDAEVEVCSTSISFYAFYAFCIRKSLFNKK